LTTHSEKQWDVILLLTVRLAILLVFVLRFFVFDDHRRNRSKTRK
jgi:hypothetical protein